MSVKTHVGRARTRVRSEQEAVDARLEAMETFLDRIEDLSPEPTPAASSGITATAGTLSRGNSSTEDRCRTVRTAFAETIRPYSVDDVDESKPLLETIQTELTDSIAVALAPTTGTSFSPELKRAIVSEAGARRAETEVLRQALGREESHLEDAAAVIDDITAWIAGADETPLTELGFESLQHRHETLTSHRERCEGLARKRQAFLEESTNRNAEVGIRHRDLVSYLYGDAGVDHPILATIARLDAACAECQRAVRSHLVRRA